MDFIETAQVSLDDLSSVNIPSTLEYCYIALLGFSSSQFNVFLFVGDLFNISAIQLFAIKQISDLCNLIMV